MTLDQLEASSLASKATEHEIKFDGLTVVWDGEFEYYDETRVGVSRPLDRDEAVDFLAETQWRALKATRP